MLALSENGWRVLFDAPQLQTIHVAGGTFRFAPGDVAVVLSEFIRRFDAEVEPIHGPVLDDWSWAVRPIRGQSTGYSNHASGTAVDLNALSHARGLRGTFTAREITALRRVLADLPCLRFGGDFTTVPDEMHTEIHGDAHAVRAVANSIRARQTPPEDDMPTADEVVDALLARKIQTGWHGDGTFSPDPALAEHPTVSQILTGTRGEVLALKARVAELEARLTPPGS